MSKKRLLLILLIFCISAIFLSCIDCTKGQEGEDLSDQQLVARGKYLVDFGSCHTCHSPKISSPDGLIPDSTRLLSGHPSDVILRKIDVLLRSDRLSLEYLVPHPEVIGIEHPGPVEGYIAYALSLFEDDGLEVAHGPILSLAVPDRIALSERSPCNGRLCLLFHGHRCCPRPKLFCLQPAAHPIFVESSGVVQRWLFPA